jgi:hypothetical protein
MKSLIRFLPLPLIPAALALLILATGTLNHPGFPVLLRKSYQSFVGVMMLLMQL